MIGYVLVAVLAAATVSAGPAATTSLELHSCAGYCKGSGKLSYEVGKSYIYDYRAPMTTTVNGVGSEESGLQLTATVEIHIKSTCDLTMKLSNVSLEDSLPSNSDRRSPVARNSEFSSALERTALMFSFQGGVIDELCVSSDEPAWVLNVKRGVLSMFQNTMRQLETDDKVYETDVIGECETEYKVVIGSSANTVLYEKSKNPLACSRPMDNFLSFQSTPYDSPTHAQSQPLVTSEHKCYVSYEDGTLLVAVCNEIHLFRPFSNGESGAVTRLQQNLLRTGIVAGTPGRVVGETTRTTLLFQHEVDEIDSTSRANAIVSTLEELDRKTASGVESDVPRIFAALVATLRTTGYPTLAKVFSHTREGHTRKFLLDAMPLVGTADGLTVMTDLFKSGEISDSEMDSWLTSLTFIKRPTLTMLMAVSSLLDKEPRAKAVLGISAMIRSFCQRDSDCRDKEPVSEALGKMERLLGSGCHVKGRQDMEMKIVALKGIGNAGVLPSSLENIAKCYQQADNPMEVRLAAITAHRRMPCLDSWRHSLLDTYTDMQQDTELRIAAYLTVMQCPSARMLQRLKEGLYKEEVNQVASFVWTHLTNLQETSSRWKQHIRDLLTTDFLRNKFQTDARKFSRNYEASTFIASLNAGATAESNIVFTPQSYLPRSAMLNLTLDIFGESVNVFEFGARAEGFEQIVEDAFGPGGYFPDKSLKKVLQKARGNVDDDELENSVDDLASTFNAKRKLAKEPSASLYARVFGNEIHYSRYQGIEELLGGHPHIKNPIDLFAKLFGGKDVDFTNSFVFLDASYKIPTIVGIPLEFAINGSATVGLKMNGHVDLRDLWRKNSLEIQGRIMPSAAVQVTGTMSLDAFVAKAGLLTVSTLHTNTYLDGKVLIQGGSVVDVKMNVPRGKVEILEVSSKMFLLHRERPVEILGDPLVRETYSDCSSATLSQLTGMQLCSELSYQNSSLSETAPYFPLTGPVELHVNLLKTDSFDFYELNFQKQVSIDSIAYKLHLDTPNSVIQRKVDAYLSLDAVNANIVGSLQTPFVKMEVSGKLDYDENLKSLSVDLRVDDRDLVKTQIGLLTVRNVRLNRYEPTFTLFVRDMVDIELKGRVNFVEGAKYNAALKLSGLSDEPLLFSADVTAEDGRYELIGSLDSPIIASSVHANLRHSTTSVSTKLTVEYSLRQARSQTVSLAAKIQSSRKGDMTKNSAQGSLQMSAAPRYNLVVGWDLTRSNDYAENKARFGLGPTEWQTRQLYRLRTRGSGEVDFAVLCTFTCPAKNVDYQVDVQYKTTENSLKSYALAQLNSHHRFLAKANYFMASPNRAISIEITSPWHSTTLEGELIETRMNAYTTRLEGRHTPAGRTPLELKLTGAYIDASTPVQQLHEVNLEVTGDWSAKMIGGLEAKEGRSMQWVDVDVEGKTYAAIVNVTKSQEGLYSIETSVQLVDRAYHSMMLVLDNDDEKSLYIDLQLSKRLTMLVQALGLNGNQTDMKFELYWDKESDPSRRISLTANLSRDRRAVVLEFPGQYIKSEVYSSPTNLRGLLEWASDQKITFDAVLQPNNAGFIASASLTTPFTGLEAQSVKAVYENNVAGIKINTELAWLTESLTFHLNGGSMPSDPATFLGEIHLTSSLASLSNIRADIKHTARPNLIHHIHTVDIDRKPVIAASWRSQGSDIVGDFAFQSPVDTLSSAKVTLKRGGGDLAFEMSCSDSRLKLESIRDDSGRSCLFNVITPYPGFENTTAKFSYGDLKIAADLLHNKTSVTLYVSGTKSDKFVLGTGVLITSFSKPLEVGFTHSTDSNFLKEGVSIASDGEQLILASVVGTAYINNFVVTADLTMPDHSVIASIENRFDSNEFLSRFTGVWNNDRIATSIVAAYSSKEFEAVASISGSALSQDMKLIIMHNREPGTMYKTTFDLTNMGGFTHELTIKNWYNWDNVIIVKTPWINTYINNKQREFGVPLKLAHDMWFRLNGTQASAQMTFIHSYDNTLDSVDAKLVTPWTHPIVLTFQLPGNETVIQPKLRLQYSKTKEISIESTIQYQLTQSKLQLEIKSPFCKPITVNAMYNVSVPTKAALLTLRWEDKQMDLKSTVHFEREKAMGVLVATRSDVEGQIVNANFKYDVSDRNDLTGHLKLLWKEKEMQVDLSGVLLSEKWRANCDISTPFNRWQKMSALFDVDLRKETQTAVLTVARNSERLDLSGSVLITPKNGQASLSLTSSIPCVNGFKLYGNIDHTNLKATCEYAGKKAGVVAKLSENHAEITIETPVTDFEVLFGQTRYETVGDTEKSWALILQKNNDKLEVSGGCKKLNDSGVASITFLSPFKGLEVLAALLEHEQTSDSMKTNIVLRRNTEIAEVTSSFVSNGTYGARIGVSLPIEGYENLDMNLNLSSSSGTNVITLVLAKNEQSWESTVELRMRNLKYMDAKLSAETPISGYETIQSGFSYHWLGDCSFYFQVPEGRNEIKISPNQNRSSDAYSIKASLDFPILKMKSVHIEGEINIFQPSLQLEVKLDNETMTLQFEVLHDSLSAAMKAPIAGYESVSFYSEYKVELTTLTMNGFLQISENKIAVFHMDYEVDAYDYYSFLINIETPIIRWEKLSIGATFDLRTSQKHFTAGVKREEDQYATALDWTMTSQMATGNLEVKTPIKHFELLNLGAGYNMSVNNLTGILVLQRNTNKLEGVLYVSDQGANVQLETPWDGFKSLTMSGTYQGLRGSNQLVATMNRNKVISQIDLTVSTDKDTTKVTINSPFNICRTLSASFQLQGLSSSLSIITNSVSVVEFSSKVDLDSESAFGLHVNMSSPLLPANYNNLELSSQYDIQKPMKSLEVKLLRNKLTALDFTSSIAHAEIGGFTYLIEIGGEFPCFDKTQFMVEYRPEGNFIKSSLTITKALEEDKYSAQFGRTNTTLHFAMKSPIKGFEHFTLILSKSDDTALVEFSTTILYYDLIKLESQINLKNNDETFITFSMQKDKEFANADWKLQLDSTLFAKSSLSLATSYENYEKAGVYVEYDLEGNSKGVIVAVERNNRSLKVETIIIQHGVLALETSLNVTSSCFEDIKFYGGYDLNSSDVKKLTMMGLWDEDWQVDVRFLLESNSPTSTKLSLVSLTPYLETTFSFAGSFDFSDPSQAQTVMATFSGFNVSASVRAVVQDFWKLGKLSVSVGNDVNAKALGFGVVSWKLVNEREKKEAQLVLDFGEGRKTEATILVGLGVNNVQTLVNFIDFLERSYEFKANWSSSKYQVNSQFGYKWSNDEQILLESEFNYVNYYPSSANIKFTSPFRGMNAIEFSNKWSFDDGAIRFNSSLNLEEFNKIALNIILSKNHLFLNVAAPNTKPLKVEISRSAARSSSGAYLYLLDSAVSFGSWKNQFIFNHSLHSQGNNSVEATLTTPIRGITFLHLNAKWNLAKKEAMLLIEKEHQKWGISSALLKSDGRSHLNIIVSTPFEAYEDVRLETWCDVADGVMSEVKVLLNKQVAAVGSMKMYPSSMNLNVESPLKWFDTMSGAYEVKLDGPMYEATLEGAMGLKNAKLQASIDAKTSKMILTEILFSSSWTEDVALSGVYEHEPSHSVRMILRTGGGTAEISGTLKHIAENLKREIELESYINGEPSFVVKTGYNWQQPLKKLHLHISSGKHVLRAQAEGKVSREGITGDLQIETPYEAVKLVELNVQVEKTGYLSETGSFALRFNAANYQTRYSIDYAPNSIIGHLSLHSPYFQIEEATVNVKHGKNNILVNVGVDGKTCIFEGSFQLEEPTSFLKAKLSAPFVKTLELIEVSFELDMNAALFNFKTQWTPTELIKLALHFGFNDFSLEISTPFEDLRSMEVSNKIQLDKDSYKLVSKVVWNAVKVDVDGSMTLTPFIVDLTYDTTFDDQQVASGHVALAASREKASGHFMMMHQLKEINIAGEIDTSDLTNLVAKLNINVPFYDIVPITAIASLKQKSFKELQVDVYLPNAYYKVAANYALVDNNLKVGLDLDMPVVKSNIILGGSFSNIKFQEVEANVFINDNKISTSYKLSDKVLTGSLDLSAPFFSIASTRVDIQASTEFNPDIHGSVTINSGKFFGSVSASLTKTVGAFSTRFDFDIPLLLGPLARTARFSATNAGQQYFVETRYDDGRQTRSASIEVSQKADWRMIGRATGPAIGLREVSFVLQKNWESLWINLMDKLIVEVKHDANSGSVRVDYGGKEHQLVYEIVALPHELKGNLAIESPSLKSKKISLQVEYQNNNAGVKAAVQCISGTSVNSATIQFTNKEDVKTLILHVTRSSYQVFRLDTAIVLSNVIVQGGASLELFGTQHMATLNYSRVWPADIQLTLYSPYLPEQSFNVKVAVSSNSVAAFVGFGKNHLNKYISVDANLDSEALIASFNFEAPSFDVVSSVRLSGAYLVSNEVSSLSFESLVSSANTTTARFSLSFLRTTSRIHGALEIATPFADYRLLQATVQIPLLFSTEFDLFLAVHLPTDIDFGFDVKFHYKADKLQARLAANYQAIKFSAGVNVENQPVPTIELYLKTPLPMFKNYRLHLRRQQSLKDGDDFVNFVEWNDNRVELRHTMVNKPGEVLFRIQLTTPFSRYLAGIQFAFNDHKKALITLGFPGLDQDWIIDFDFRCKNPRDLSLMTLVQAPIFRDFKVASFMIGNRYVDNNYRGVITGRYNEEEMSVLVEGSVKLGEMRGEVKAQVNNQKIHVKLTSNAQGLQRMDSLLEVETPFEFLRNTNVSLLYSLSGPQLIGTNVIYNSNEMLDLSLILDNQDFRTLTVRNPWRPMSLKYKFYNDRDIEIWTEVCWDLNNIRTSKFGGGFFMTNGYDTKNIISIVMQLPSRAVSVNASCQHTSSLRDYSAHLSLDVDQTFGFRVMLDQGANDSFSALGRLDFPLRSFELTSHKNVEASVRDLAVRLLWDAAGDRSKKIGAGILFTKLGIELRFEHFALKQDIVLSVEHSLYQFIRHETLWLNLRLEYSSLDEDHLVLKYRSHDDLVDRFVEYSIQHLASNLDEKLSILVSHLPKHTLGKASLSYLDSNKRKRSLQLYGKVHHLYTDVELRVSSTENNLALNGSLWLKDNGYQGITLDLGMNSKAPLNFEARLNAEEMSVEVEIGYGTGRRYIASAGIPTSRHLTASVRHQEHGVPSVDGEATLRLNTSRLLWTRVAWKLGLLDEMQRIVLREYTDVTIVAQSIAESFGELMDEDFIGRLENVAESVGKSVADVGSNSQAEMNVVGDDFQIIGRLFEDAYERNDFYLQSIHQTVKNLVWSAQDTASCLVKQALEVSGVTYTAVKNFFVLLSEALSVDLTPLRVLCSEIRPMVSTAWNHTTTALKELKRSSQTVRNSIRSLLTAARDTLARTDELFDRLSTGLEAYSKQLVARFSQVAQSYVTSWQHGTMLLYDSLLAIERSFTELKETVYATVMSVKEVRELAEIYGKYSSWLEEFRVQKYFDEAIEYLNIVGDILIEDFQLMVADYKEYIDTALNVMSGHLEKVDKVPGVVQTKQFADTIYQKMTWLWRYLKISEELRASIDWTVANFDQVLVTLVKTVSADSNKHVANLDSIMIVRPGLVEISLELPVEWDNFFQLPEYSELTFPDYLSNPSVGKFKRLNYLLTNTVTDGSADMLEGRFLPPFGATALVVGGSQFITFDRRFYSFTGDCSYLLASDLVDNRFSIILNHHIENGKPARKSLTILSEGHRIHIGSNHRVTVDGIKTELPAHVGNAISIVRNANRLLVESENLVLVDCNLHHDVCAVKLSGWYFGKTGGLLGSFDNEPSNDLQMPNGETTADLERFTSSWRVGSSKRCSVANIVTPEHDSKQCVAAFTDPDSPLAACFPTIDPKPFALMCQASSVQCASIVVYALECVKAGVAVEVPADCVRCSTEDGSNTVGGETISVDGESINSGDVVFVVENADCVKNLNLAKLVDKLDVAMTQLGLEDNRFSVVLFGAELPPHTRTTKGDIWGGSRAVEKALQDLPQSDDPSVSSDHAAHEAILFASSLSFRAGASKTVVLVQCGTCSPTLDVATMLGTLNENDITLHLLQPGVVQLRSATQGRNKLFGADLNGAYTARNVKSITPSRSLLKEVILPKDNCSPLALETNGTVFNLDRATEVKKHLVAVKKFVDVWSRRVAQTARPAKCQTCECTLDGDGVGQFKCSRCNAPTVDQLVSDWQSLLTEDFGHIEIQNAKYSDELV